MDKDQIEELRYALRRYLAARPSAAPTLDMISHAMRMKGLAAPDQTLRDELTYWAELTPPQIKIVMPEHGSTTGYQITPAGRVAESRGQ